MASSAYSKWRTAEARQAINQSFTPRQGTALQIAIPDVQTSKASATVTHADSTLAGVSGMSVNLESNNSYAIRVVVFTATTTNAGYKCDTNGGTATMNNIVGNAYRMSASAVATIPIAALNTSNGTTALAVTGMTYELEVDVNQGGTFIFQAAQNATHGDTTQTLKGSYITATRLP